MTLSQGRAADAAGIQFRELNAARGPAVRGPRAQQDRELYKAEVQRLLAATPGLEVVDGAATDLVVERGGGGARAAGVVLATGVLALARVQCRVFWGFKWTSVAHSGGQGSADRYCLAYLVTVSQL